MFNSYQYAKRLEEQKLNRLAENKYQTQRNQKLGNRDEMSKNYKRRVVGFIRDQLTQDEQVKITDNYQTHQEKLFLQTITSHSTDRPGFVSRHSRRNFGGFTGTSSPMHNTAAVTSSLKQDSIHQEFASGLNSEMQSYRLTSPNSIIDHRNSVYNHVSKPRTVRLVETSGERAARQVKENKLLDSVPNSNIDQTFAKLIRQRKKDLELGNGNFTFKEKTQQERLFKQFGLVSPKHRKILSQGKSIGDPLRRSMQPPASMASSISINRASKTSNARRSPVGTFKNSPKGKELVQKTAVNMARQIMPHLHKKTHFKAATSVFMQSEGSLDLADESARGIVKDIYEVLHQKSQGDEGILSQSFDEGNVPHWNNAVSKPSAAMINELAPLSLKNQRYPSSSGELGDLTIPKKAVVRKKSTALEEMLSQRRSRQSRYPDSDFALNSASFTHQGNSNTTSRERVDRLGSQNIGGLMNVQEQPIEEESKVFSFNVSELQKVKPGYTSYGIRKVTKKESFRTRKQTEQNNRDALYRKVEAAVAKQAPPPETEPSRLQKTRTRVFSQGGAQDVNATSEAQDSSKRKVFEKPTRLSVENPIFKSSDECDGPVDELPASTGIQSLKSFKQDSFRSKGSPERARERLSFKKRKPELDKGFVPDGFDIDYDHFSQVTKDLLVGANVIRKKSIRSPIKKRSMIGASQAVTTENSAVSLAQNSATSQKSPKSVDGSVPRQSSKEKSILPRMSKESRVPTVVHEESFEESPQKKKRPAKLEIPVETVDSAESRSSRSRASEGSRLTSPSALSTISKGSNRNYRKKKQTKIKPVKVNELKVDDSPKKKKTRRQSNKKDSLSPRKGSDVLKGFTAGEKMLKLTEMMTMKFNKQ